MVENGNPIALLGNHKYNALCFNAKKKNGGYLRKHSIANMLQHYETLKQFQNKQDEYDDYVEWFKTLPVFYETSSFTVHPLRQHQTLLERAVIYFGVEFVKTGGAVGADASLFIQLFQ
jgi:hypothetical protein